MRDKPQYAGDYGAEDLDLVRSALLTVATRIGDLIDETVIIGGLVPSLLVGLRSDIDGFEEHVGTKDVDIGLTVALLSTKRYQELTKRLRRAGFSTAANDKGNPSLWRWKHEAHSSVFIEFLISGEQAGQPKHIEPDFAAIQAPALPLAFEDRVQVNLDGHTYNGARARRPVWVCGPGAYVVLKALTFEARGENKDAYDLHYMVRFYGDGPGEVANKLRSLLSRRFVREAISVLARDFAVHDGLGPVAVALFKNRRTDSLIQAEVAGDCAELLRRIAAAG